MVASMEKPDESWDASSMMNNTFVTAINGNNIVAMNSPAAIFRYVTIVSEQIIRTHYSKRETVHT